MIINYNSLNQTLSSVDQKKTKSMSNSSKYNMFKNKSLEIPKLVRSTHRYCQFCENTMPSYKDFERCAYCNIKSGIFVSQRDCKQPVRKKSKL